MIDDPWSKCLLIFLIFFHLVFDEGKIIYSSEIPLNLDILVLEVGLDFLCILSFPSLIQANKFHIAELL